MKLIDGDALITDIKVMCDDCHKNCKYCDYKKMMTIIRNSSAVDVVTSEYHFKCSQEYQKRIEKLEEQNATQAETIRKLIGER